MWFKGTSPQPYVICFYNNGATVYAIVNDRLSVLELATTPDVGHDGWAKEVTLSYIHERFLFT